MCAYVYLAAKFNKTCNYELGNGASQIETYRHYRPTIHHTFQKIHTLHCRFTALLELVRDYPGEQVPER